MPNFVLLLDYDGTLVHSSDNLPVCDLVSSTLNDNQPPPIEMQESTLNLLMEANKPFLDQLTHDLDNHPKGPFNAFFVGSGSKRQTWRSDTQNSIKNNRYSGSSFTLLERVVTYLKERHPSMVLDKFLTSDHFFGKEQEGTVFDAILGWLKGESPNPENHFLFEDCPVDNSKISLIFAWVQRIGLQGGGVVRFVDDELQKQNGEIFIHPVNPVILSAVIPFFEKYPELIPQNVTLEIVHCTERRSTNERTIQGTGHAYSNYLDMMEEMMRASLDNGDGLWTMGSCNCFNLYNKASVIKNLESKVTSPLFSGISMQVLGGFLSVVGVAAIAMAFLALNASTFGVPGLVVASVGMGAFLAGAGFFGASCTQASSRKSEYSALSLN